MYIKESNISNYVVIRKENEKNSLHFYVTGTNENLIKDTSNALLELLNFNKKNILLKVKTLIGEQVKLENGVTIGVVGTVKKPTESTSDVVLNERVNLLKETIKKF